MKENGSKECQREREIDHSIRDVLLKTETQLEIEGLMNGHQENTIYINM